MGLVKNERQEEKPESDSIFIKLGFKSLVQLKSNMYKLVNHYIQHKKTSMMCIGRGCILCERGEKQKTDYYYWAKITVKDSDRKDAEGHDSEGVLRLAPSSFFDMNQNEEEMDIDKRGFYWIIKKTGEGLETRYSTVRGLEVKTENSVDEKELEENNQKMVQVMTAFEKKLLKKYSEETSYIPSKSKEPIEPTETGDERIDPEDIPF